MLHDAHQAAYRYEKEPKLPLIKSPTLVVSGTEDMFYSAVEKVKSLIPRSRVEIIQCAGNHIANQKPKELAQAILDFLKDPSV